jgi:hypothetical protein
LNQKFRQSATPDFLACRIVQKLIPEKFKGQAFFWRFITGNLRKNFWFGARSSPRDFQKFGQRGFCRFRIFGQRGFFGALQKFSGSGFRFHSRARVCVCA